MNWLRLAQLPHKEPLDLDWDHQAGTLATLRKLISLQEEVDRKGSDVDEETLYAPTLDGYSLPLTVFRTAPGPTAIDDSRAPLIVLYFGGGFGLGSPVTMAATARSLVKRLDAVVVAPTYRLAREHPFPTGVLDGWYTLEWIANNATTTLRADPSQGFIVGWISTGGNITNVITHLARARQLQPPITGNWLSCPGVRLRTNDRDKLPQKYGDRNLSRTQQECIDSPILPPGL